MYFEEFLITFAQIIFNLAQSTDTDRLPCSALFYLMRHVTFELRVRLTPRNRFKHSSKIFLLTVPRCYFFCGSFVLFMSCVCQPFMSVHCCLVVTCWERADLLALVCDV